MTKPRERVCLAMTNLVFELVVMVEPAKFIEGRGLAVGASGIVLPPTTREAQFEAKEMTVPEMVAAAPPYVSIVIPETMILGWDHVGLVTLQPSAGVKLRRPGGEGYLLVPAL